MGSLSDVISRGRLVWRLLKDDRVPAWIRVGIPLVVLIYVISPVDIIPDFILGLGQLDDLGVILLGMNLVIRLSPQHVVDEHRMALGYDTDEAPAAVRNGKSRSGAGSKKSGDGAPIEGEYKVVRPRENE